MPDSPAKGFLMAVTQPAREIAAMVGYRRNRVAGATYFFTVTLRDRRSDFLVRHIHSLREAWRVAGTRIPHKVIAAVVLPEHLHAVIEMQDAHADYPRLWQEVKKGFTRRTVTEKSTCSPWQPRYWEHTIRDDADLAAHVDYVHFNPVRHRHVTCVKEWPYSSFHRYVRMGWLPADWAGIVEAPGIFGER